MKRWAATVPASMTPTGVSKSSVVTAISWMVRFSASSVTPRRVGHHVDGLAEAVAQQAEHGAGRAASAGVLPNSITSRTTNSVS